MPKDRQAPPRSVPQRTDLVRPACWGPFVFVAATPISVLPKGGDNLKGLSSFSSVKRASILLVSMILAGPVYAKTETEQRISDLAKPERKSDAINHLLSRSTTSAEEIKAALSSESAEIKISLLRIVRARRSAVYLPVIQEMAISDSDIEVRREALAAIGEYREGEEAVTRALNDPEPIVRVQAVLVAAQMNGDKLPDYARAAFKDKSRLVRLAAQGVDARAAKKPGLQDAREVLVSGSQNEKLLAIKVIAHAGDASDIDFLEQRTRESRSIAVWMQAKIARFIFELRSKDKRDRLPYLQTKLKDKRNWARQWAADELAQNAGPEGIQILRQLAASEELGRIEAQNALWVIEEQSR